MAFFEDRKLWIARKVNLYPLFFLPLTFLFLMVYNERKRRRSVNSMTFFDEISKNLTGYGKEAARKAKDAAQVLQLKAQIRGEKQKINELYAAIGAVYFKNHRDDSEDEYKNILPEIRKYMVHVAEEKKLSQLDTTEKCPCCGAAVKKGDSFCSKCGTPIQKEEDGTEEQHIAVTEDDFVQEETAKEPVKETTEEKKTEAAENVVQETETENTTEEETEQKEEPVSEPEE